MDLSSYPDLPPLPDVFVDAARSVNQDVDHWTETGQMHTLDDEHQHNGVNDSPDIIPRDTSKLVVTEKLEGATTNKEGPSSTSDPKSSKNSFSSALGRLQSEMKGLRKLDLSLFHQLWSLHEAIQEFKDAVQGDYSETNSLYSCGSFSSYGRVNSLTSLDSLDFNDDSTLDYQQDPIVGDSLSNSASSLLAQINELRERAEIDFKDFKLS